MVFGIWIMDELIMADIKSEKIKQLYNQAVIAGKAMRIARMQLKRLDDNSTSILSQERAKQQEKVNQFTNSYQTHLRAFVVLAQEEMKRLESEMENITWMSNELNRFEE